MLKFDMYLMPSKRYRRVCLFGYSWLHCVCVWGGGVAGMALWCGLQLIGQIGGCPLMLRKCSESGRQWLVSVIPFILCAWALCPACFSASVANWPTSFFICLFLPLCYIASKWYRLSVRTPPLFIVLLCAESRRHRIHWPCWRHPHNQSTCPGRKPPSQFWQVPTPSPSRRPGLEVPGPPEVPKLTPERGRSWSGRREKEAALSWGSGQAGCSAPAPDWKREEWGGGRGGGGGAAAVQREGRGGRAELREPHASGEAGAEGLSEGGRTLPWQPEEQGHRWR